MKRYILPILVVFIFVFESSLVELLPKDVFENYGNIVPRFLLITILFITVYLNKYYGFIYGIIFGLLYDIVYIEVLGIYLFSMPIIAYLISKASTILQSNIFVISTLSLLGVVVLEFFVYGINTLIGITTMPINFFLQNRLIPTVILNLVFIILFSYPLKKYLTRIKLISE